MSKLRGDGLVVSESAYHAVGCGFASRPGHTKDHHKYWYKLLPCLARMHLGRSLIKSVHFLIVTELFMIFRANKFVSSKILIHHAKQRPCNFSSEKKIPVFILEKILSKKIKFH